MESQVTINLGILIPVGLTLLGWLILSLKKGNKENKIEIEKIKDEFNDTKQELLKTKSKAYTARALNQKAHTQMAKTMNSMGVELRDYIKATAVNNKELTTNLNAVVQIVKLQDYRMDNLEEQNKRISEVIRKKG